MFFKCLFLREETAAHCSLEGPGWGRRSPVKIGEIMCVKHAGVPYQHFASDSSQGAEKKEHFLHFLSSFGKKNSLCGNAARQFIR